MNSKNWKFLKKGIPLFSLVIGSAFGISYFQQVKYDSNKIKHKQISLAELKANFQKKETKEKPQTPEEIYLEFEKSGIWNKDYKNVRGPHIGEDNTEWKNLTDQLKKSA